MLNHGDGHAWNTMLDYGGRKFEEAGGGGGGFVFSEGGFAKRGVRTNPPGYGVTGQE